MRPLALSSIAVTFAFAMLGAWTLTAMQIGMAMAEAMQARR